MHMRTTLNIDDEILAKAARLTGVTEKTALVRLGLHALVAAESSKRLALVQRALQTGLIAERDL